MRTYLALVMVTVGLLGCGAQELPGGLHDAGRDLSRPVIDATERDPSDAGCPPPGKMTCSPYGCPGSEIFPLPECIDGIWSCPILLIDLTCPVDAGTSIDAGEAGTVAAHDGSAGCPPLRLDGGQLSCGCGSDTTPPPKCVGGTWVCPAGSSRLQTCSLCANQPLPPPGCRCDPANGALTCTRDAGADAPSDRTGIGPG
jgi:hypothetical protein